MIKLIGWVWQKLVGNWDFHIHRYIVFRIRINYMEIYLWTLFGVIFLAETYFFLNYRFSRPFNLSNSHPLVEPPLHDSEKRNIETTNFCLKCLLIKKITGFSYFDATQISPQFLLNILLRKCRLILYNCWHWVIHSLVSGIYIN